MAPHPSILAWRIPRTEEPGRLQSTVSHRVTWLNWLISTAHVCFSLHSGVRQGHCCWAWRVISLHASKPISNFLFYSMSKPWVRPTIRPPPIPRAPPLLCPHLLSLSASFCSNHMGHHSALLLPKTRWSQALHTRCSLGLHICLQVSAGITTSPPSEQRPPLLRQHLHRDHFLTSPLGHSVCPYGMCHQLTYYIYILWFTTKRYTIINIYVSPLVWKPPNFVYFALRRIPGAWNNARYTVGTQ